MNDENYLKYYGDVVSKLNDDIVIPREEIPDDIQLGASIINQFMDHLDHKYKDTGFLTTVSIETDAYYNAIKNDARRYILIPFHVANNTSIAMASTIPNSGHYILISIIKDQNGRIKIYLADSNSVRRDSLAKQAARDIMTKIFTNDNIEFINWGIEQEGQDCAILVIIHVIIMVYVLQYLEWYDDLQFWIELLVSQMFSNGICPRNSARPYIKYILDRLETRNEYLPYPKRLRRNLRIAPSRESSSKKKAVILIDGGTFKYDSFRQQEIINGLMFVAVATCISSFHIYYNNSANDELWRIKASHWMRIMERIENSVPILIDKSAGKSSIDPQERVRYISSLIPAEVDNLKRVFQFILTELVWFQNLLSMPSLETSADLYPPEINNINQYQEWLMNWVAYLTYLFQCLNVNRRHIIYDPLMLNVIPEKWQKDIAVKKLAIRIL